MSSHRANMLHGYRLPDRRSGVAPALLAPPVDPTSIGRSLTPPSVYHRLDSEPLNAVLRSYLSAATGSSHGSSRTRPICRYSLSIGTEDSISPNLGSRKREHRRPSWTTLIEQRPWSVFHSDWGETEIELDLTGRDRSMDGEYRHRYYQYTNILCIISCFYNLCLPVRMHSNGT